MKKIVVALGGNALQKKGCPPTAEGQLDVARQTCEYIAELSCRGYKMAIVHGNGPQVGNILLSSEASKDIVPPMPFDVCAAMSQGYIGYHLQQAMGEALRVRNRTTPVVALLTQVVVDKDDSAFQNPTKPIGPFYTEKEAIEIQATKNYTMVEDAGRGWRRVVPSPVPKEIVEIDQIKHLWDSSVVVACGGGGIPVVCDEEGALSGIAAVIDKDYAAELLAEKLEVDMLVILTAVDHVAINFNKPNQQNLTHATVAECKKYIAEGQFAPGSMLPKIQAAMRFVENNPTKKAIITSLDKVVDAIEGKVGTVVSFS